MERHPVPQNIMDVEFKLFGALTIRQFGYAGAGFVIALLFYFSGLPEILRWIFIGFSLFAGGFLALIKINGQPSSVFLSNFLVSMFEPQARLWRKSPKVPDVLREDNSARENKKNEAILKVTKERIAAIPQMPLQDVPVSESEAKLDKDLELDMKQLDEHFDFLFNDLPQVPTSAVNQDRVELAATNPLVAKPKTLASAVQNNSQNAPVYQTDSYAVKFNPITNQTNRPLGINPKAGFDITQANFLKGQVVDKENKIIEAASVNVVDANGTLLRSTATDQDGKFSYANGMKAGQYFVDVKKEGMKFPRYSVQLKDNKIMEIKLQAL